MNYHKSNNASNSTEAISQVADPGFSKEVTALDILKTNKTPFLKTP